MAAGYRWYVGDLRTGKIARQVDLTGGRWSMAFNAPGTLEGSFPLLSGEWPSARADAPVAKAFIGVTYVDVQGTETWLEAGPLWTTSYNKATGDLHLGGAGLWTYFDHRKLMAALSPGDDPATSKLSYVGLSLPVIAKRLIEVAQSHTGGELPIVLPDDADLGAGNNERNYPGYELGWIGERLKQLSEVQNGPEIQFVPRRRSDDPRYIEWVMKIGTTATDSMIYRPGSPHLIDTTVPGSPLRDLTVAADGSAIAERVWAAGQGEAEGRPIAYADDGHLIGLGYPLLEGEVTATDSVSDTATLNAKVAEELGQSSRPVETWQVVLDRDTRRLAGRMRPGDFTRFRIAGDPYLADGDYDTRVMAMSGGEDSLSIDLMPRRGDL